MTKKVKKVFVGMLSAMIVSVMALACVGCMRTDNAQDAAEPEPVQDSGVYDAEGNMLVSGEVYDMSRGLMFAMPTEASPTAADGITLHATLEPDTVQDWPLEWSVECGCETCKTAIELTPQGDNCVVKCNKNFWDPLKIKVVPKNIDIAAECKVDYQTTLSYSMEMRFTDVVWERLEDIGYLNPELGPLAKRTYVIPDPDSGIYQIPLIPFTESFLNFGICLWNSGVRPVFVYRPGTDWEEVSAKVFDSPLTIGCNILGVGKMSEYGLSMRAGEVARVGDNAYVFGYDSALHVDGVSADDPSAFLLKPETTDIHAAHGIIRVYTKAFVTMHFLTSALYHLYLPSDITDKECNVVDVPTFNKYVRWLDSDVGGSKWAERAFGTFFVKNGRPKDQLTFGLRKRGFYQSEFGEVPENISLDQTSLTY